MYRSLSLTVAGAADSSLKWPYFGPLNVYLDNINDLQVYSQLHRVNATDTEFTVPVSSMITTAYFVCIASDYPVQLRFIAGGQPQWTMHGNNVAVTNFGAPTPDQCVFITTSGLPNNFLTLTPISGAVQTANVKVFVTGDPLFAYP